MRHFDELLRYCPKNLTRLVAPLKYLNISMKERENNRLLLTDSQTMRGRLLESLSKGGTSDLQRIEQTFSLPAVIWRKLHPSPQKGKRLQAQNK